MNLSSRIGRRPIGAVVFAALLALVPSAARAQMGSATVSASLADSSVEAGQSTEYRIKVVNGILTQIPPAPEVNGLNISYPPHMDRTMLLDVDKGLQMRQVVTTTFTYRIDTTRAGQFTIPGQQIELSGAALRTLPVTLTVLERGTTKKGLPGLWLASELIIPKRSAYVGESIPVEYRTFFGLVMRFAPDSEPTLQGEGFSLQKFTHPQIDLQTVQGSQVHAAGYKTTIAGAKIGRCTVGPAEVQPVVQVPWSPRQMFTDPNDYQILDEALPMVRAYYMPQKRVKLSSGTVEVEIKPLPPGKPAAFSGAIGEFKLEAEADPRKAQAGDPVTVRLVLSGRGNFDRIAAPVLSDDHGLRTYPATSKFKADDEVGLSGIKTFEQVAIADGPRSSIPAYHFNYLDPGTGKYVEIDTPPIPVEIIGGSTPAPSISATPLAVVPAPTPTLSPPPRPAEDILYIRADAGPARTAEDFLPLYRRHLYWETQGGIFVALLGLVFLGGPVARSRSETARTQARTRRRQVELERALSREGTVRGEFYSAATQLVRLRAAATVGQSGGGFTVAEICRVHGLDSHAGVSVEEIFQRHDELAYSGAQVAREPVPNEERRGVLATLKNLEKR